MFYASLLERCTCSLNMRKVNHGEVDLMCHSHENPYVKSKRIWPNSKAEWAEFSFWAFVVVLMIAGYVFIAVMGKP